MKQQQKEVKEVEKFKTFGSLDAGVLFRFYPESNEIYKKIISNGVIRRDVGENMEPALGLKTDSVVLVHTASLVMIISNH